MRPGAHRAALRQLLVLAPIAIATMLLLDWLGGTGPWDPDGPWGRPDGEPPPADWLGEYPARMLVYMWVGTAVGMIANRDPDGPLHVPAGSMLRHMVTLTCVALGAWAALEGSESREGLTTAVTVLAVLPVALLWAIVEAVSDARESERGEG